MYLPDDSTRPVLVLYLTIIYVHTKACTSMLICSLLMISKMKQEQANSMSDKKKCSRTIQWKLLSNKRQWTIDMDKLGTSLRERSQSQSVLYDSINVAFSEGQSCSDGKELHGCRRLKVGESETIQNDNTREFSGMTEELCLDYGHGWTKLYMC